MTGFFTTRGFVLLFTQISLGTLTQLGLGTSLKTRETKNEVTLISSRSSLEFETQFTLVNWKKKIIRFELT